MCIRIKLIRILDPHCEKKPDPNPGDRNDADP